LTERGNHLESLVNTGGYLGVAPGVVMVTYLESLVNAGRYLEARELAMRLRKDPQADPLRVDQLFALSLSKSGYPEDALAYLDLAYRRNPDDPETAGILGGIYKELFKKHQDSKYAILSRDTYSKNFGVTKNYYTGINAATMSAIAGRSSQGREIASQVIANIGNNASGFWELATLGEAFLLTKDRASSIDHYVRARQLAGNDWGKVISVYNQLWLLNHYMPVPKEIQRIFSPPTVVASIGHMIDHPARTVPRFPAAIEQQVAESMAGAVRAMNAGIGYCSLACGSDILFAEAMEEAGAEVHIFLPFEKKDFIDQSIRFAGENWIERFERLISKFPVTYVTHDSYDGNDEIFAFQCRIIFGSAVLRSMTYHQKPMLLSVQSEIDLKRKSGGTRDTIRLWPFNDRHININPDQFVLNRPAVTEPQTPSGTSRELKIDRPILYMVSVDMNEANGMEKERVYKSVNAKMKDQLIPHRAFDLQDDCIFLAFDSESGAIDFVQLVNAAAGSHLQQDRSIKIGLHAGPVHVETVAGAETRIVDSSIQNYIRNISRLAPRGTICVSSQFASLLALNTDKYKLTYAGIFNTSDSELESGQGIYNVSIKI
jgi:tetratricopeptide (TPR) repeat protein